MASAGVICVWIERLSGGVGVCKGVFCFGSSAGAGVTAACCTAAGGGKIGKCSAGWPWGIFCREGFGGGLW